MMTVTININNAEGMMRTQGWLNSILANASGSNVNEQSGLKADEWDE